MFWDKKSSTEKKKEIRLSIMQVEKLIERAIDNANNAVIAFDKSYENTDSISQESTNNLAIQILSVTEFMSAFRFVKQNEKILFRLT